MKTHLWLFAFFLVAPPVFAGAPDLKGTWEWSGEGYTITLTLNPDGTGKLDESNIKYSVQGDHLIVNDEGDIITYKFQWSGDKLTLSEGDLDEPTVFTRKGSGSAKGIGALKGAKAGAGAKAEGGAGLQSGKAPKSEQGITGTWTIQTPKGPLVLDLKGDGSGSLAGSPFQWQYEQNILMLSISGQTIMYNASLSGDQLTLSGGDLQQPATFQRQSAGSQQNAGPSTPGTGTSPQNCNAIALAANVTGGCAIRLATPTLCEEIDLRGGQSYEFAWTTDGTNCETPYTFIISGNPATEANAKSWKLSTNVEQGITRNGGLIYVNANDLAGLTTDNGLYHWVVQGWYGSHPDSRTFRVKQ